MNDLKQELNEWLATEIMEWRIDYAIDATKCYKNGDNYNDCVEDYLAWNPLTNLKQAFKCLEAYCPDDQWWKLKVRSDDRYSLHFHIQETGWGAGWHDADTKPKSIVGAIAKAENRFDEFKEVFS